jgi:hypothetical protein
MSASVVFDAGRSGGENGEAGAPLGAAKGRESEQHTRSSPIGPAEHEDGGSLRSHCQPL